jgi:type IV pilus assembly protein PilQ
MSESKCGDNNYLEKLSVVLLFIAVAFALNLIGCTASKDVLPPSTAATQPAPVKPQNTIAATQSLRELSVREERGQTILTVKFVQPITQFRHFPLLQPARIVLDIPTDSQSASPTDTFRIDTNAVAALRINAGENNLRLLIEVAAATVPPYSVDTEDGGLKLTIGSYDTNAAAKRTVVLVKDGQRMDVRGAQRAPGSADVKTTTGPSDDRQGLQKSYTGQKISLDFKDADIKNVFRLLAEVSGLNIVVTADVNRRVTLRLVEVPWDQAMDLLISTNGLDKEQIGNVVRVSTAGTLKAEKDALLAARKATQDLEPLFTTYLNINYAKAKELEPKVKALMSKRADNAIVVDERSNTIMVRDIEKSLDDISTLVTKLDLRTPQVLIESNLIETTPTFSRALGFQLGFDRGGFTLNSSNGAGPPFIPAGSTTPPPLGGTFSIFQNKFGALSNLSASLTAAEQEGNIKIISRPSVLTLNNVASTIQSLRILRVNLPSSTNIASGSGAAAGTAVATEKIPVGITLSVTPQVSSDGFVLMNISVKSSSLGSQSPGSVVPDELSREAVSNVLVRDGETIVIGGIMKDTSQDSESGVPYLKDIPFLGWAFKNSRVQKDFEELMVFITPRIMTAGSENLPSAEQLWREQLKKTNGEQLGQNSPANP